MAENTAANVEVPVIGHVYIAPLGTTLPTGPFSTLNAAFVNVGYLSEDGLKEDPSRDTTEINAWGGGCVRTIQTKYGHVLEFEMLEATAANETLYFGDADGLPLPHKCLVFDYEDDPTCVRRVYPDVQITGTPTRTYNGQGAASLPVRVTCYKDAAGKYFYPYRDEDGVS